MVRVLISQSYDGDLRYQHHHHFAHQLTRTRSLTVSQDTDSRMLNG